MIDPIGIRVPVAQKIRVKAGVLALIAILFRVIAYACSTDDANGGRRRPRHGGRLARLKTLSARFLPGACP